MVLQIPYLCPDLINDYHDHSTKKQCCKCQNTNYDKDQKLCPSAADQTIDHSRSSFDLLAMIMNLLSNEIVYKLPQARKKAPTLDFSKVSACETIQKLSSG